LTARSRVLFISQDRKLTIGASAKVTADIIAREVAVFGNVKGNLRAARPDRDQEGRLGGRGLTTARIMIEDGAYFKGSIEIDKSGDASSSSDSDLDKPAYTRSMRTASSSTSSD